MAAIFKSSLQNLSPLPTSLKVKPLFKPKTGLNFFVNHFKPKAWLRSFVNAGALQYSYVCSNVVCYCKYSVNKVHRKRGTGSSLIDSKEKIMKLY